MILSLCLLSTPHHMTVAKGLSNLFLFSKSQLLVSLILSVVFLGTISLISALILVISFLLLAFVFICSSLSGSFSVRLGLFEIFLLS